MSQRVFISHTSKNDDVVKTLELHSELTWVDSRQLTGEDGLKAEIEAGIQSARHFLVLLSIDVLASRWVKQEIRTALETAKQRTDGYRVVPVILPGVELAYFEDLFPEELVYISIEDRPTDIEDAVPQIFAALGEQLPNE